MTLLAAFLGIATAWYSVFPQARTWRRAARQALGSLVCLGRRCLSRIIWTNGSQQRSWSTEYFLHSRCRWQPQQLFRPTLHRALAYCPGRLVGVAVDDTRLAKTGRCIQQAFYQRDPLSPPFHVNLMRGLRFLQASLLVPLHRRGQVSTRALPIRFEDVAPVKKPSRKAPRGLATVQGRPSNNITCRKALPTCYPACGRPWTRQAGKTRPWWSLATTVSATAPACAPRGSAPS